ncbi:MAG: tryptophan-rich sensory protein [Clostridia bacterium]|nr:tryptophan-rich sensory protein [Oscillospiraceae bacterium]MBR6748481.1 tryptophan-rich sensory protein [Clostridia bacterium]
MKVKSLVLSVAISLGVGTLAGFLTRGSSAVYESLTQPPLSPPAIVFPIVWSILYVLMGISAYLVWETKDPARMRALAVYGVQLAVNFVWPLLFFNAQMFTLSFAWLLLLWGLALWMLLAFHRIRPAAGLLQIPYLVWLSFAAYLNLGVALLN